MKKALLLSLLALSGCRPARAQRPNILVVLADDMGYSDLGCFGGEIATPNIDRLAAGGIRFNHFYNAARCAPTRAGLMTGLVLEGTDDPNDLPPHDLERYTTNLSDHLDYANVRAELDALLQQKMDAIEDEFRPVTWYRNHWFEDRVVVRAARGDFPPLPPVDPLPEPYYSMFIEDH